MGCERAGEGRRKMERGQGRGRGRRRRGKPGEEESAELKSGAENRGRVAGRAERQRSAGVSNGGKAGVGGPGGRRGRGAVIPVLGPWTQIPWKTTHAPQTSAAAAAPTRLVRLALPCEGGGFWSPAHLAPLARSAPAAPPPAVLGSRRRRTTSVREGAGGA
ncbi:uncharacterized protein LOC144338419 isoform X1 [Macaca mulatta]